jgi:hypothetical protein
MSQEILVKFEGLDAAKANKAAVELRQRLLRIADPGTRIEIRKDDPNTQDLGATLVLVLGTPAIIALVKGIRDFIAKTGDAVVIETPNGRVVARGSAADNINVAKTVDALTAAEKK